MDDWVRIGDHEPFPFNKTVLNFAFNGKTYLITIDPIHPDHLAVEHNGFSDLWPIFLIHHKPTGFKVSGLTDAVPEILDEVYWFDLLLGDIPQIDYWGNLVLIRTDFSRA